RHHPDPPSFPTRRSSDLRTPARRRWAAESPPEFDARSTVGWEHAIAKDRAPSCNCFEGRPAERNARRPKNNAPCPKEYALENTRSEEHTSELQSRENLVC